MHYYNDKYFSQQFEDTWQLFEVPVTEQIMFIDYDKYF